MNHWTERSIHLAREAERARAIAENLDRQRRNENAKRETYKRKALQNEEVNP